MAEPKNNTANTKKKSRAERIAAEKARCDELVTLKIHKSGDKHKDSLFVQVNGKNVLLKAGATVRIARKYALVIEEAARQHNLVLERIEQVSEKDKN